MFRFFILFLFISKFSFSQETKKEDLYEQNNIRTNSLANEALRVGDIYLALTYFEEIYNRDSSDFSTLLKLADCNRLTNNYKKAEYFYSKIANSEKVDKYPNSIFYLAQMQKSNGKYLEAIKSLDLLKSKISLVNDEAIVKMYKVELAGCKYALSIADSIQKETIVNIPSINDKHIDFSPIPISDNKLIFGSLRMDEELIYTVEEFDSLDTPSRKFYVASKENEKWIVKSELEGPFNVDSVDVANGSYSLDSTVFYFTKCSKNWMYNTICHIYKCDKTANGWSEPVKLNELVNLPDFTSTHPTIGREPKSNKEVLYFSSDRIGGKGELDIWYAEYDPRKKTFKKPKNAGAKINTLFSESTPFYDMKTKTLYFASNGKIGIGGFDVYKAIGSGNQWSEPSNLGKPINSSADDLDFILKPSSKGGFIVSNRVGGQSFYHSTCCDDIYEFNYNQFISIKCILEVKDFKTKECLKDGVVVNVFIKDEQGKFLSQHQLISECTSTLEIRPNYNYYFEAKHPDYFTNSLEFSALNITESTTIYKLLELTKKPLDPIVISNIQYEFNSSVLNENSKKILDTTLLIICLDNPIVKIEIAAHTDDVGSEEYNMKLSQKRAESVTNYLVSKGIQKERLISVGYGESKPLTSNATPEGRDSNRRTEFKILGEIEVTYKEETEIESDQD